jgi:hypothetical protein
LIYIQLYTSPSNFPSSSPAASSTRSGEILGLLEIYLPLVSPSSPSTDPDLDLDLDLEGDLETYLDPAEETEPERDRERGRPRRSGDDSLDELLYLRRFVFLSPSESSLSISASSSCLLGLSDDKEGGVVRVMIFLVLDLLFPLGLLAVLIAVGLYHILVPGLGVRL